MLRHPNYEEIARDLPKLERSGLKKVIEDLDRTEAEECKSSLSYFVHTFWHVVEPSCDLIWDWPMQAICDHLQMVTEGEIKRLLINVPPGMMKSLLVNVFWPAWEWARGLSHMRYVCVSYAEHLTVRDNGRFTNIVRSRLYRRMFGDQFKLTKKAEIKVENNKTGWKLATSTEGVGTGERGDRVLIDDPHNVKDGESELRRNRTLLWFRETLPTRMNNYDKSAIVVIMQRVHEEDVSGEILAKQLDYVHLMLPMRYEPKRHCVTMVGDEMFFSDPREEEGELLCPDRYSEDVLAELQKQMGSYATAAQFQQSPVPRGGGILKTKWWKLFPPLGEENLYTVTDKVLNDITGEYEMKRRLNFPPMEFVLCYSDTAYTEKELNDDSAAVVLGVWRTVTGLPRVMLMTAWTGKYEFPQLVRMLIKTCRRYKVDKLVIEGKASGISAAQEIEGIVGPEEWATETDSPVGDKTARAHSVTHLFEEGLVSAPDREWADIVIEACGSFPKGKNKDVADACIGGVKWLRNSKWALRREEKQASDEVEALPPGEDQGGDALYPV